MHNLHYGNIPFALSVYCQQPEHRYCTRYATSHNYVLPRVVTNRGQGSIKFAGPKAWAEVPKHLKEVAFRKPFSKKLKKHILSQIYVEMPPKAYPKMSKNQYNELKRIFQSDDEHDEFFGFESENSTHEITFLNDGEATNDNPPIFDGTKESLDLDDIFQNDNENENDDFIGFITNASKNSDLEVIFLNDSTDTEFTGF